MRFQVKGGRCAIDANDATDAMDVTTNTSVVPVIASEL